MANRNEDGAIARDLPLSETSTAEIGRSKYDSILALSKYPEPFASIHRASPKIRILILTDGKGGFADPHEFKLSLFVEAISADPGVYARVDVTTATRNEKDDGAVFTSFSFMKDFDPECYDEVWLFGMERDSKADLSEAELEILTDFMNSCKGGVFATGDHEDLGAPLCSKVPRVRNMRKWRFDRSQPRNPSNAPPVEHEFRHDTLRAGINGTYELEDEKDDVPQIIFTKMHISSDASGCDVELSPHELLSTNRGVIKVLPDHMHEGECVVPRKLTKKLCDDSDEYPVKDGKREVPEVIAMAQTPESHTTCDGSFVHRPTQVSSFGVIGVYDGRKAGVGRVVVDSSFHHFIDLNLKGFAASKDATSKDRGQQAYEDIKSYFQNIRVYLAPEQVRREMFFCALLAAYFTYPLNERILSFEDRINQGTLTAQDMSDLGAVAHGTIASLSSPALASQWHLELPNIVTQREALAALLSPSNEKAAVTGQAALFSSETVANFLLGGVVHKLTENFRDTDIASFVVPRNIGEIIAAGASSGAQAFLETLIDYNMELNEVIDRLNLGDASGQISVKERTMPPRAFPNPFEGKYELRLNDDTKAIIEMTDVGKREHIDITIIDNPMPPIRVATRVIDPFTLKIGPFDMPHPLEPGVIIHFEPGTLSFGETKDIIRGKFQLSSGPSVTDGDDWTATRPPGD